MPNYKRILPLSGENGAAVACRVHDEKSASTIPRISNESHTLESATRTILRLRNLRALRGNPGESMIGPADLYGSLEKIHEAGFTIDIDKGFPTFKRHDLSAVPTEIQDIAYTPGEFDKNLTSSVDAKWINGVDKPVMEAKKAEYKAANVAMFGDSLFPDPGLLEIEGVDHIILPAFDATQVDLSSFKARLVQNDQPFNITDEVLPPSDDFRAVSYLFEPGYPARQVNEGGGLFLETHSFSQTMTPLDEQAEGFVTLGRWDEQTQKLILVGVRIPFGFTLIIGKDCIHGDTTLKGMYLMCMTSNHVTMSDAKTVFLKNAETKKNVSMSILGYQPSNTLEQTENSAPLPIVLYKNHTEEEKRKFTEIATQKSVILNPGKAYKLFKARQVEESVVKGKEKVKEKATGFSRKIFGGKK